MISLASFVKTRPLAAALCSLPFCFHCAPMPGVYLVVSPDWHKSHLGVVDKPSRRTHLPEANVESAEVNVHFEQRGSELTAVEIGRNSRSPVIVSLHRALFAMGIVVLSYQARLVNHGSNRGLVERVVLGRRDGGAIKGPLNAATRAAILPIALAAESGG